MGSNRGIRPNLEGRLHASGIVILNGAPRSGKSSIATAIVESFPGSWINLGVDWARHYLTPEEWQPGIGLRPGRERPDLEPKIRSLYRSLHEHVAQEVRNGSNVVMDVGYHCDYSEPFDPFEDARDVFHDLPYLFVGVRCPLEVIMLRRNQGGAGYLKGTESEPIPLPVQRWQEAVHENRGYDLEVDTSQMSPEACAEIILAQWVAKPIR